MPSDSAPDIFLPQYSTSLKDGDLVVSMGCDRVAQYFIFKKHMCETSGLADSYIGIDIEDRSKLLNWRNIFWDRVATVNARRSSFGQNLNQKIQIIDKR